MITFFYTYSGIIGQELLWVDIVSFYAAAILGNVFAYKMIKGKKIKPQKNLALIILLVLLSFFMFATYATPDLPLFGVTICWTFSLL